MRKQRKQLPDLRSMIGGTPLPADHEEEAAETAEPRNQDATKPRRQETEEPRNQETKKASSPKTKEPENQGSTEAQRRAEHPNGPRNDSMTAEHVTGALRPARFKRLPPVQVCVWIDPAVAGMIDTARGTLATRLAKRPTRSRLVEAVLRKGLDDPDSLVDLLWPQLYATETDRAPED